MLPPVINCNVSREIYQVLFMIKWTFFVTGAAPVLSAGLSVLTGSIREGACVCRCAGSLLCIFPAMHSGSQRHSAAGSRIWLILLGEDTVQLRADRKRYCASCRCQPPPPNLFCLEKEDGRHIILSSGSRRCFRYAAAYRYSSLP